MKSKIIYLSLLLIILTACNESFRHPNGVNAIIDDENQTTYRFGYNLNKDGSLNKAFILHPNIEYTDNKKNNGVYWIKHEKDSLWVNGNKIKYPDGIKVVAIKSNGDIVPIKCLEKELC